MDPTLSAILGGAGLLSNLYANQQAAKRAREEQNIVNSQIADLTAWKNIETNRPYTDSALGRSILTKAFGKYRDNAQTAKSTAAVTGASDESVIAQKAGAEQALGDVVSQVAGMGTSREDNINNQYRSQLSNLMAIKLGLARDRTQSAANLATSAGSFLQSLAPALSSKSGNPASTVYDPMSGAKVG